MANCEPSLAAPPPGAYNAPMLISEPIEVEMGRTDMAAKVPVAFMWRGERYEIVRVVDFWFDTGFGAQKRGKAWYTRRHRNCYVVEASDGHVYEIYLDRGGGQLQWHLYRRLDDEREA